MTKDVVLYATTTMADWEYGYLVAGLAMANQSAPGRFRLLVTSDGASEEVRTMGGLRIRPDGRLSGVDPSQVAALVLPGASTWDAGHDAVLGLATELLRRDVTVAGICGATLGLARAGLLNDRVHTSNAPEFLTSAAEYSGADHYVAEKVAVDGRLITAPATAPIDFAKAVFETLQVFPPPIIDAWYGLYTTGERRYYDQLIGAPA